MRIINFSDNTTYVSDGESYRLDGRNHNIQRIDNALGSIEKLKSECEEKLTETKNQFEIAKMESKKEFPKEAELAEKTQRLAALDALLNMDKREPQAIDMVPDEDDMPKKKNREMER